MFVNEETEKFPRTHETFFCLISSTMSSIDSQSGSLSSELVALSGGAKIHTHTEREGEGEGEGERERERVHRICTVYGSKRRCLTIGNQQTLCLPVLTHLGAS